jgi:catechol 2,3-dioxygenase-like lactoylglutathione lyase family enzyme
MASSSGVFLGLDTVLLRVRDIESAKTWYQQKLGFAER